MMNTAFVLYTFNGEEDFEDQLSSSAIKLINIRELGRKNAKDKNDTVKLKDLALQTNTDLLTKRQFNQKKTFSKSNLTRAKAIENIKMNRQNTVFESHQKNDFVLNTASQIEFKKGSSVDELNTHELVYHAFRMRTAKQYKNAVIKNINKLKKNNPTLFSRLKNSIHKMRGRISYDINGNVVSIKTLKWSDSQEIQDFFVNALKDIRAIPNPPKGILTEDGFRAIYDLQLTL